MPTDTQVATIIFLLPVGADSCVVILEADPQQCVLLIVWKHPLLPGDRD